MQQPLCYPPARGPVNATFVLDSGATPEEIAMPYDAVPPDRPKSWYLAERDGCLTC